MKKLVFLSAGQLLSAITLFGQLSLGPQVHLVSDTTFGTTTDVEFAGDYVFAQNDYHHLAGWDANTGKLLWRWKSPAYLMAGCLAASPAGDEVAVMGFPAIRIVAMETPGIIYFMDPSNGAMNDSVITDFNLVTGCYVPGDSANMVLLISKAAKFQVIKWNRITHKTEITFLKEGQYNNFLPVSVDVSPDGKTLAVGGAYTENGVLFFDITGGSKLTQVKLNGEFNNLDFSSDGTMLAAPDGKNLNIISMADYTLLYSYETVTPAVYAMFHPNNINVAISNATRITSVDIVNITDGTYAATGFKGRCFIPAFNSTGTRIAIPRMINENYYVFKKPYLVMMEVSTEY